MHHFGRSCWLAAIIILGSRPVTGQLPAPQNVRYFSAEEIEAQLSDLHRDRARCGSMALWASLHLLGRAPSLDEILSKSAPADERGVRLGDLAAVARDYVHSAHLVESAEGTSIRDLSIPAILVIDENHAVVLAGFGNDRRDALIIDASQNRFEEALVEDIDKQWSGLAIQFESRVRLFDYALLFGAIAGATALFLVQRGRNESHDARANV